MQRFRRACACSRHTGRSPDPSGRRRHRVRGSRSPRAIRPERSQCPSLLESAQIERASRLRKRRRFPATRHPRPPRIRSPPGRAGLIAPRSCKKRTGHNHRGRTRWRSSRIC
jgi:hypothetical protein